MKKKGKSLYILCFRDFNVLKTLRHTSNDNSFKEQNSSSYFMRNLKLKILNVQVEKQRNLTDP